MDDLNFLGWIFAGTCGAAALLCYNLDDSTHVSKATNSTAIVSEYHPSMSSGSDGAGFAEGYARMQIARNIQTGLVQKISGGKN